MTIYRSSPKQTTIYQALGGSIQTGRWLTIWEEGFSFPRTRTNPSYPRILFWVGCVDRSFANHKVTGITAKMTLEELGKTKDPYELKSHLEGFWKALGDDFDDSWDDSTIETEIPASGRRQPLDKLTDSVAPCIGHADTKNNPTMGNSLGDFPKYYLRDRILRSSRAIILGLALTWGLTAVSFQVEAIRLHYDGMTSFLPLAAVFTAVFSPLWIGIYFFVRRLSPPSFRFAIGLIAPTIIVVALSLFAIWLLKAAWTGGSDY